MSQAGSAFISTIAGSQEVKKLPEQSKPPAAPSKEP